MSDVQYPEVPTVQLSGEDGNAFFIISRVRSAMERAGLKDEAKSFFDAALAQPSYDALLQFVMQTVRTA
jgi:hypothetical protein